MGGGGGGHASPQIARPTILSGLLSRKQGRIHGSPCCRRLGRGKNDLGRGSNNLCRGSDELGRSNNKFGRSNKIHLHTKSKSVTDQPTDRHGDL